MFNIPQTSLIDKREIRDAAVPVERSVDVVYSGRENLHRILPVLLQGTLPLFSIMTLWHGGKLHWN